MKIAVDFDGTIVEHKYPAIGEEIPFAIDALKKLAADGHQLVLWTSREGQPLAEAVEFCRQRGLEFYAVNSEYPEGQYEGAPKRRKVVADVYIDDRNIGGLPEWGEIYAMLSGHGLEDSPRTGSGRSGGFEFSGSDREHSSHHGRSRSEKNESVFSKIAEKCRSSREKFNRVILVVLFLGLASALGTVSASAQTANRTKTSGQVRTTTQTKTVGQVKSTGQTKAAGAVRTTGQPKSTTTVQTSSQTKTSQSAAVSAAAAISATAAADLSEGYGVPGYDYGAVADPYAAAAASYGVPTESVGAYSSTGDVVYSPSNPNPNFGIIPEEPRVDTIFVRYKANSSKLEMNYMKNGDVIASLFRYIDNVGARNVRMINIAGFTALEGLYGSNIDLSRERNKSVSAYFNKEYPALQYYMTTSPEGEAWSMFRKNIVDDKALSKASKNKILKIIDGDMDYDTKKKELKTNLGTDKFVGDLYNYISCIYFPMLRCVRVTVQYKDSVQ